MLPFLNPAGGCSANLILVHTGPVLLTFYIKLNTNTSISSKKMFIMIKTSKYHAIQVLRNYFDLFWPARIFNETGYKEK